MLKIDDLLGVRFVNHGRSIEQGFDCYGLAIEVSKRLGHTLTDIWYEKSCSETFCENADSVIKNMSSMTEPTDKLEEGNLIVFFNEHGRMVHIGVILDEEHFIHADIGGVKVMVLEEYYRKHWKVYKWRQ